ncbi:MAG: hypothetical protein BWY66_02516 [bacterium ADurb.Bin374]|nr:MAG: hypothetical protein BWY66_02516 [bacterium ADurb.Bin374]
MSECFSLSSVYWKISPRPVLNGAISGSMPGGSSSRVSCSRSNTSCRAKYGFVPSSNTMTICDSPDFDRERTCWTPFIPDIFCSIGKDICCSTSLTDKP